jgi:hypothetical protein
MTYCVHGEPQAAAALQKAIKDHLRWPCDVARDGEKVSV